MILMLVVHMVCLVTVILTLKIFVDVHLRLEVVMLCSTIEKAMVLPMVVMAVHVVGIVRGRVRAW
jgi:hypothetical protein